jgi:hypothetical protein
MLSGSSDRPIVRLGQIPSGVKDAKESSGSALCLRKHGHMDELRFNQ